MADDRIYGYFMDGPFAGKAVWADGLEIVMHKPPAPVLALVVAPLPIRAGMETVRYRADSEATIRVDGTTATPYWLVRDE